MGCQCLLTLRRLFLIFFVVSVLLIIAGLVFVVYGAIKYENVNKEDRRKPTKNYGAVIDAGGSGTRLILYTYRDDTGKFSQRYFRSCEGEGIAKYAPPRLNDVSGILKRCMDITMNHVSMPRDKTVPLYFAATGGMRILKKRNLTQYNELYETIKTTIHDGPFNASMVETISGEDEAMYGWIATNTISKQTSETSGILDLGSTSLQISFQPSVGTVGPSGIQTIKLNGKDVKVYENSYLCFGRNEMENRLFAKMIKDSGYQNTTDNPCLFDGFTRSYVSTDLFQQPCVYGSYAQSNLGESIDPPSERRVFEMRGTGNQSACQNKLEELINLNCTGEKTSCGLNDIYQPPVNGHFQAVSGFYYAADFIGLAQGSTVGEFKAKTDELCVKPWKEIDNMNKGKYAAGRCFDATYAYFLLTKGFKFTDDSKVIHFQNDLENKKVQWSLGLIYTMKNNLLPILGDIEQWTIIEQSPNMIGLIVIGIIFIILGSILLALAIKAKRSKDLTLVATKDDVEIR